MFLLFSIFLTMLLSGIEIDIFTPSFPEMIKQFSLTESQIQLTLSINFLSYCLSSLFVGTMGDKYGRRIIILLSLVIFVVGSVFCVFAENFIMIVLGRFFQGFGMGGPAVLSYVVIADRYSKDAQTKLMSIMNGLVVGGMAFAPIIGAFVNAYYGWRGNFAILLGMGVLTFVLSFFALEKDSGDKTISISPSAYMPVLKNKEFMMYAMVITFIVLGYWVFIGFSPILYIRDMGIPLENFGFYQGALCASFAITSIFSFVLFNRFSKNVLLKWGFALATFGTFVPLALYVFGSLTPLLLTLSLCLYAAGNVFPIAILYPICIECVPGAKGRSAAMIGALRLILNGIALQAIAPLYSKTYYELGIFIFVTFLIGLLMIMRTPTWKDKST